MRHRRRLGSISVNARGNVISGVNIARYRVARVTRSANNRKGPVYMPGRERLGNHYPRLYRAQTICRVGARARYPSVRSRGNVCATFIGADTYASTRAERWTFLLSRARIVLPLHSTFFSSMFVQPLRPTTQSSRTPRAISLPRAQNEDRFSRGSV